MTTTTPDQDQLIGAQGARFATAGVFLEALAVRDFAGVSRTCSADVQLQALVPAALREWVGREEIEAAFTRWFGDASEFQMADAAIGDVAGTLHMRWRVRLQAARLGDGWFTVEQQVYADTDPDGHISRMRLLCSGYCREQDTAPACLIPVGHDQPE